MTGRQSVRTIRVVVLVALTMALVRWRDANAQLVPTPAPKYALKDLLETESFKKLNEGLKGIKDLEEALKKQDEYYEKLDKLSPEDDQYEPEYDLPGSPELPSLCKDSQQCAACFKQPYADLQSTRYRFDKLRRVNRVTKNMLRDAIAFGDAMAGLAGGLAPLAWNTEKEGIRASEGNFNKSYDAKYAELLATLKNDLMGIAACEEQVFGNDSWYERFGFFYHQFMAEAYRRPD